MYVVPLETQLLCECIAHEDPATRLIVESLFRSVDMHFQERIQQLSRAHEVFKEETTLAHRQHMHDHVEEQRVSRSSLEQLALKTERSLRVESEGKRDTTFHHSHEQAAIDGR